MKVPYTNFKTRVGDNNAVGGCTFIGGEWKDLNTSEIFENKKIVVFALPGAFTPTCSSQQLPGYEEKYDQIKALGIDEVYCLSVNDAFVMGAWGEQQGAGGKVMMVGDGNAELTEKMGLTMDGSGFGMGTRSLRYSMIVRDGVVETLNVEGNPGQAVDSGAENLLSQL